MYVLAHLSDLHATPVRVRARRPGAVANKRALGWLSWWLHRRREYRPEILAALVNDLHARGPDHIAVTGDLTNLGLEDELTEAASWLERLGGPREVSLVPGNHDAYVRDRHTTSWAPWGHFIRSDRPGADGHLFPSLRVRGPLALIGLCSALPTPPGSATGTVGAGQLAALDGLLRELRGAALCRVVLVHHPPTDVEPRSRRRLTDAGALREVLACRGADLVLHGHTHRTSVDRIRGPDGEIPVVGVRSSSALGRKPGRRAQYHLYRILPSAEAGARFQIEVDVRGYDAERGCFVPERRLSLPPDRSGSRERPRLLEASSV